MHVCMYVCVCVCVCVCMCNSIFVYNSWGIIGLNCRKLNPKENTY